MATEFSNQNIKIVLQTQIVDVYLHWNSAISMEQSKRSHHKPENSSIMYDMLYM